MILGDIIPKKINTGNIKNILYIIDCSYVYKKEKM